jgi:hypothetical protein
MSSAVVHGATHKLPQQREKRQKIKKHNISACLLAQYVVSMSEEMCFEKDE